MEGTDSWLTTNTFHHTHFADIGDLVRRKQELGLTVSVCIPTLNEAATIGPLLAGLGATLGERVGLVDEIAVIDSGSTDRTRELAAAAGAEVFSAATILPEMGHYCGKGENLWKAVHQLGGDLLVFLDGDLTSFHPGFVTGLLGPLLTRPEIGYVKACYTRPPCRPGSDCLLGGGRVTEILIRPLFSLYYPRLGCVIQPLAGECAARRSVLEQLAYPVGYGVETAHLIDLATGPGMTVLGQTDLGLRCHRSRSNRELGRMAFAILQVINRRLRRRGLLNTPGTEGCLLHQFQEEHGRFVPEFHEISEPERPPLLSVAAYRQRRALDGQPAVATPVRLLNTAVN